MTLPAPFDIAAGLLMLVLALYGLLKGFVRLVLDAAGMVLGWWLAARYSEPLAERLGAAPRAAESGPDWHRLAAFALIFVGVTLAASVLAWLITRALAAAKLGCMNRLAGAGLGLLAAIVAICAVTVPLLALWPPDAGGLLAGRSVLAPYAVAGGGYLKDLTPDRMRERFSAGARRILSPAAESPENQTAPATHATPAPPTPGVTGRKPAPAPRPR